MWVQRSDEGFVFGGLTPYAVETLRAVPMLLESSDLRVRRRLLPETYEDVDDEAQWRRHATPELERLFLSRSQLLRRDLGSMRQVPGTDSWLLLVPHKHCNAWLSSLNAARLALYALNELTSAHMERDGFAGASSKQQEALLRIHFLAEIQCQLLGDVGPEEPPEGRDGLHDGEPPPVA
jgi:Domain of unknown function (DUF2017)